MINDNVTHCTKLEDIIILQFISPKHVEIIHRFFAGGVRSSFRHSERPIVRSSTFDKLCCTDIIMCTIALVRSIG